MTLQNLTIYLLLTLPTITSFGQADHKFTIESLQEDFQIFRGALEESHAGIYWYRTKSEMDDAFDYAYESLDHEMTELEFYRIIAPLISKIGCGHTWIATTESTQEKIWGRGKVLPLKLKFLDRKAYCLQNNSHDSTSIQPGDEILSINNYSIDSLLTLSNKFSSGDGFIEVGKWRILDNAFNIEEVYKKVSSSHPGFLHPNLSKVTLRPWGAKEFALRDNQVCIIIQQW